MAGSGFGKLLHISTFGESHNEALGVVIDGFPAGVELSADDLIPYMNRRRPGQSAATTNRAESDTPQILSGTFNGRTTGTPIAILIRNENQHSADYEALRDVYRPGHADFGFDAKYGLRDYRGGGRSSGRETAARVAAGAVCQKLLSQLGITCYAYTESIGSVRLEDKGIVRAEQVRAVRTPTGLPDADADARAMALIEEARREGDSLGGTVVCVIEGMPAGIGEPVFDKLDALLTHGVMSIGAVKAVEIGDGIRVAGSRGSDNNDAFIPDPAGGVTKRTNHAGGILGGISDGSPILLRAHFKPTPSISKEQETVNREGAAVPLVIHGRHDPVVVPRAVVVVESMCAITVLDALLVNMSARADRIVDFYN